MLSSESNLFPQLARQPKCIARRLPLISAVADGRVISLYPVNAQPHSISCGRILISCVLRAARNQFHFPIPPLFSCLYCCRAWDRGAEAGSMPAQARARMTRVSQPGVARAREQGLFANQPQLEEHTFRI